MQDETEVRCTIVFISFIKQCTKLDFEDGNKKTELHYCLMLDKPK